MCCTESQEEADQEGGSEGPGSGHNSSYRGGECGGSSSAPSWLNPARRGHSSHQAQGRRTCLSSILVSFSLVLAFLIMID